MNLDALLPMLLGLALVLPLASFTVIVFLGPKLGKLSALVATGAIGSSFLLSILSLVFWLGHYGITAPTHDGHHVEASHEGGAEGHSNEDAHHENENEAHDGHDVASSDGASTRIPAITGNWYTIGVFGKLKIAIGYYIDALTICMCSMVALISTCIHIYSMGYMHEETEEYTDHEVTRSDGEHFVRPGRYHRFFQYLSLFSFSMLGVVIAGSMAMTFIFWELVGICSYFLIGFYYERKSASNAGNKAFIVNRVGDFGMIIGIMAIFGGLGTLNYGDIDANRDGTIDRTERGMFSLVRTPENNHALAIPDGFVKAGASEEIAKIANDMTRQGLDEGWSHTEVAAKTTFAVDAKIDDWRSENYGYWIWIVAGLGIFCGCVGKSAQFPLHVWLPDAMEGPTPVSALLHSATMVAAGVFLVGRFYPFFPPEALLVVAYVGAITLFMAATIAITATDIKRVLAYSTVSQLGYMMLSLGMGGWLAGMLHLFTHAFFKSLLFLCSGSVIHAVHSNEMTDMGGLRKKMPITAYTMLVGCLAISGAGIPFLIGFSGYYSKDAILAQGLSFSEMNASHGILFAAAAGGAAITAFYMFRLWYMTFAGPPRDAHRYEHAHESPPSMYVPLLILSVFAVGVAWTVPFSDLSLKNLLEQARPAGEVGAGVIAAALSYPAEHLSHAAEIHVTATLVAFSTAMAGFVLATLFYGVRVFSPEEVRQQFSWVFRFLRNKWWFDELYAAIFIKPVLFVSRRVADFDKQWIDRLVHALANWTKALSRLDDLIDRLFVDGLINLTAQWTYSIGAALRAVQTGKIRQYVMFIVLGTVVLFSVGSWFGHIFGVIGG